MDPQQPPSSMELLHSAAAGAVSGIAATLAMSLLMLPAQWLGLLGTQPPRRIADRIVDVAGLGGHVSDAERRRGTTVVHLAIGAVGGAGFGLGRVLTRRRGRAPLVGLGFGSALWGCNYVVAAPWLDLFPPPWEDRPGRPPVMLTANALYGVLTAVMFERVTRPAAAVAVDSSRLVHDP
ncbi:MAG: hypothetical protein ABIQ58_09210 [Candidatus Limnocylindrales bacterium]